MTTIVLNGEDRTTAGGTVADIVREIASDASGCAVAVNDEVVPRRDWPTRQLYDGDRVEVLTAVQGG